MVEKCSVMALMVVMASSGEVREAILCSMMIHYTIISHHLYVVSEHKPLLLHIKDIALLKNGRSPYVYRVYMTIEVINIYVKEVCIFRCKAWSLNIEVYHRRLFTE